MAIIRTIEIDGREVAFKASAAIPRIYRLKFGRDIFIDMNTLLDAVSQNDPEASTLSGFSLQLFEDVAYTMSKYADPSQPDTVEEWLDQFSAFSIYGILPWLVELWNVNEATEIEAKKNSVQANAR